MTEPLHAILRHSVDVWMYEQKLDRIGLIAHTFIVFEFDESYGPARYLGLSVETRRELGENRLLVGPGHGTQDS